MNRKKSTSLVTEGLHLFLSARLLEGDFEAAYSYEPLWWQLEDAGDFSGDSSCEINGSS